MPPRSASTVGQELVQPDGPPVPFPLSLDDTFRAIAMHRSLTELAEELSISRPTDPQAPTGSHDPSGPRGKPGDPNGRPHRPNAPYSHDAAGRAGEPGGSASGDPVDPVPSGDPGERTIRVVVADDEYLVREGARSVLSAAPGVEVVGLAADPVELEALMEATNPDAVLLDIRMPPTYRAEGIEAAHRIREAHPHIGIIILSQYLDAEYALELLREGSSRVGYLLKERLGDQTRLVGAIREVVGGGSVLDPKVVDSLMEAQRRRSRSRLHGLTDREHEVLALMASGRNNAAIARELVLSERAVEKHINSIFHRLGLNREMDINQRVSAVLFFLQRSTD